MKIAMVGDANSIHIQRWSRYLKEHGHEISMVSLTPDLGDDGKCYDSRIYVRHKAGAFGYARTALAVRKILNKMDVDVIHGHYLTSSGFDVSLASRSTPKIVSAWGSDVYIDSKVWEKRQAIKYALRHANMVLGESNHILGEVKKLAPRAKIAKVQFGIDTQLFKPQPIKHDKFTFLSVRATGGVYQGDLIVKAFEQANLDAILMMQEPLAGGFHIKDYCKSRPELDKKVVWYSRRAYSEIPQLLNSCDCGISFPTSDSTSQAMMECMSCGLPVIVSDIPVNREWIEHHVNGYIAKSVSGLRDQMRMIARIHEGDGLKHISERARETIVEKAEFDTEMKKAEQIYKEVLDGSKR